MAQNVTGGFPHTVDEPPVFVCTCPMQVTREVISDLEASKYQMVEWR